MGEEAFVSSTIEKVIVNGPVTKIEESTFQNSKILQISLPETLEEIGGAAFGATSLQEITIPSSVKTIAVNAFALSKVETVTFNGGDIEVQVNAFGNCSNLKKVYVPDCNIAFDVDTFYKSENVTIITPAGSAAEEFAKANGIKVENN